MRISRFTWTLLLVGTLFLGSAWIVYSREPAGADPTVESVSEAPIAGYRAPDFTLTTLSGETFTLSELRGQPVVLNFWATWCPPCRAEIPYFQAASVRYNGQVAIVGVDDSEPRSRVAPFASEMQMSYPLPLDEAGLASRLYNVNSLPATFFIDASGIIQQVHIGLISQGVLQENIERLLRSEAG